MAALNQRRFDVGEIADMILDGLLDEETGDYIGDKNIEKYGVEAPGFPIRSKRDNWTNPFKKIKCPACSKMVKPSGMSMHKRDVHSK